MKSQLSKKSFLVMVVLLLASLACYSDSKLWFFGVTEVPPTSTFLPTPDPNLYPSRFEKAEIVLAPQPTTPQEAFFFVTKLPQELLPGVRNASGSCEYGSSLEILYVGHQWENFAGNFYFDDVILTTVAVEGQEATTETLFDFEGDSAAWTLAAALPAGKELNRQNNIDFAKMRPAPAEGEAAPDVANTSYVLTLQSDYQPDNWQAGAFVAYDSGADWSDYASVSVRVFLPQEAQHFLASLYVKTGPGATETASQRIALTPGTWTVLSLDLTQVADLNAVSEFGLRIDRDPARTYYLVTCTGTVGWANGERMAGPLKFVRGQSAQTRNVDSNNRPIPDSPNPSFVVYTDAEPPAFGLAVAQKKQCQVGEIVDIKDISAIKQPDGSDQIWYQVGCTESAPDTFGWVEEFRLFGPLQFPRSGGIGVVTPESGSVSLTSEPGPVSDSNPTVGTCEPNQLITTTDFTNLADPTGEVPVPYYQIQCGEVIGWVLQSALREIPYTPDTIVMVIGEFGASQPNVVGTIVSDGPAPLLETPIPGSAGAGECEADSDALVDSARAFVEKNEAGELTSTAYYHVTCDQDTGWLAGEFLPDFRAQVVGLKDIAAAEGAATASLIADFYLPAPLTSEPGPAFEGNTIGKCPSGSVLRLGRAEAEVGLIFYEVTCNNITGWLEARYIPNPVSYELDTSIWFVKPSITGNRTPEAGFSIRVVPDKVAAKSGQCHLFTEARTLSILFDKKALSGAGFRVYYQVSCLGIDGRQITGWVEQDSSMIRSVVTVNPNRIWGG